MYSGNKNHETKLALALFFRNEKLYDSHRAQTTGRIKTILTQECQTTLGLAPPGASSNIQPLDVSFNAEFNNSVDRLITGHLFANPKLFMSKKVSDGDRRVLLKKCRVGAA